MLYIIKDAVDNSVINHRFGEGRLQRLRTLTTSMRTHRLYCLRVQVASSQGPVGAIINVRRKRQMIFARDVSDGLAAGHGKTA